MARDGPVMAGHGWRPRAQRPDPVPLGGGCACGNPHRVLCHARTKARAARLRNRAPSADPVTSLVHRPFQDLVAVPCVARHGPRVDLAATEPDRPGRIHPWLWLHALLAAMP